MRKETERPPEVKILPIGKMRQDCTMDGCTDNFWGHVSKNYRSRDKSETWKIVNDSGIIPGYVPEDKVDELTAFIYDKDIHPCKGHVNRGYDYFKKQYYYYGECVIEKII